MNVAAPDSDLTPKDFSSDQEVRWCPGCGDYAILKAMQKTLPEIGATPENTVFISGIGCASRFPYYMGTYGFHTIHGRAPAIATGVKLANPDLDVWVVSGDGDALSIGGNHLLHLLRRNVNVQFVLFDNEIYGLTKGQYSPTSRIGTRSPSTPFGSIERPVSTAALAIGAGARFVARSIDTLQKHLPVMFKRAYEHNGTSFVKIFQNCIVYNDGVYSNFTDKEVAADRQLLVEHGKPMIFGSNMNRGIRLNPDNLNLEAVVIGEHGIVESDILIHDESNHALATLLASMQGPELPVALGVLYCDPVDSYEDSVDNLVSEAKQRNSSPDFNDLLHSGHTWNVAG